MTGMADTIHQTMAHTRPTELSPKEWQKHRDSWLNFVMHTAIGKDNSPIPDFNTHIPALRLGPDLDMDILISLPLLKKFVHILFLRTTSGVYHVQVLLRTEQDLSMIMKTIGWWLKSMEQGMWRTDL